jgi:hypothetical protein
MLSNLSLLNDFTIAASDGHIGSVSDFLFDDGSWRIRWLVVDTGSWLPGRKVLLPPHVLGRPDTEARLFPVSLTMQAVRESPPIDTDRPVSRQMEINTYDYYGWAPYWTNGLIMGGIGGGLIPLNGPGPHWNSDALDKRGGVGNPHLRSTKSVTGYHIHARDGEIGHIHDFLIDQNDWSIQELVIDTHNWWPGETVTLSPLHAFEVDWATKSVNVGLDRQQIKDGPRYDSRVLDRDNIVSPGL